MPTVVKTWAFASDAEGLSDGGNNANLAFAYMGGDGNPSGCVRFTSTTHASQTEFARKSSTGDTWQTWGVPAGNIVTAVQITSWYKKLAANTRLVSHTFKARIINDSGTTVHSAGLIIDATPNASPTDGTWQSQGAGTSRAVDATYQSDTTGVRLELEYAISTLSAGVSIDWRIDQIELTMTYETAPGHPVALRQSHVLTGARRWGRG